MLRLITTEIQPAPRGHNSSSLLRARHWPTLNRPDEHAPNQSSHWANRYRRHIQRRGDHKGSSSCCKRRFTTGRIRTSGTGSYYLLPSHGGPRGRSRSFELSSHSTHFCLYQTLQGSTQLAVRSDTFSGITVTGTCLDDWPDHQRPHRQP